MMIRGPRQGSNCCTKTNAGGGMNLESVIACALSASWNFGRDDSPTNMVGCCYGGLSFLQFTCSCHFLMETVLKAAPQVDAATNLR